MTYRIKRLNRIGYWKYSNVFCLDGTETVFKSLKQVKASFKRMCQNIALIKGNSYKDFYFNNAVQDHVIEVDNNGVKSTIRAKNGSRMVFDDTRLYKQKIQPLYFSTNSALTTISIQWCPREHPRQYLKYTKYSPIRLALHFAEETESRYITTKETYLFDLENFRLLN